eukprot:gene1156-2241_t
MFRIIAHLDMDCFYCQVEHKRLGIPITEPLAVQQWDSVIAVNYAARAAPYLIKRGTKFDECKKRCPSIHLIHVELIGDEEHGNRRDHAKVSLKRYRLASMEIMSILQRLCPSCERASIDEAYLDITEYSRTPYPDIYLQPEHQITIDGTILHPSTPYEIMLLNAATFILHIRTTIYNELGYTISAGIANNKMLAKQASACRKPNKQTLIPLSSINSMMQELSIADVRGMGGKLGEKISEFTHVKTAAELQIYTQEILIKEFGDKTGQWIFNICRGLDDEPVKPNLKPKSLLAFKSFSAITVRDDLDKWLHLLCDELRDRIIDDHALNQRQPHNILLQHGLLSTSTSTSSREVVTTSRTGAIRRGGRQGHSSCPSSEDLFQSVSVLVSRIPKVYPCVRIGVGVTDMIDSPKVSVSHAISNYFTSSSSNVGIGVGISPSKYQKDNDDGDIDIEEDIGSGISSPITAASMSTISSVSVSVSGSELGRSSVSPALVSFVHVIHPPMVPYSSSPASIKSKTNISNKQRTPNTKANISSFFHSKPASSSSITTSSSSGIIVNTTSVSNYQNQATSCRNSTDDAAAKNHVSEYLCEGDHLMDPRDLNYVTEVGVEVEGVEASTGGSHANQEDISTDICEFKYVICDVCGIEIPDIDDAVREHSDYHYCMQLQNEIEIEDEHPPSTSILQHNTHKNVMSTSSSTTTSRIIGSDKNKNPPSRNNSSDGRKNGEINKRSRIDNFFVSNKSSSNL